MIPIYPRLRNTLAIVASGFIASCAADQPGPWQDGHGYRWRSLAGAGRGAPGFTAISATRTGIATANVVSEARMLDNRHFTHGSGVAVGDVDGDGRPDVFLARIDGPNALHLNQGGWRFVEAAVAAGVALPEHHTTGAVLADVDGDGDLDLVLTALDGPNLLLLNDGTGSFTEHVDLGPGRGSTTAALADIDGDGDLDLYITNYKVRTIRDSLPPAERTMSRVLERTSAGQRIAPRFREHYRLLTLPGVGTGAAERAEADVLFVNQGERGFVATSWTEGRFRDGDGRPLTEVPEYFGLAARFYDVNGDGIPDLYVCNDFEDPDLIWLGAGDGSFRAVSPLAIRTTSNSAMAVDFADVDRDGRVDIFVADMLSADPVRRKAQTPSHTPVPRGPGLVDYRTQWQRNTLFWNRGDGTFAEIAQLAGVAASEWTWSTLFLDVDLDGYEDILVANGHRWDVLDADTERRLRFRPSEVGWREERLLYPSLATRNVAFRNQGDLTFRDASAAWRFGAEEDISHGMAVGDLDADGDLDVVINRLNAPPLVLRNDASAGRIAVRLAGRPPNTRGVGAKVRVSAAGIPTQEREVTAGGLYLSGSDYTLSFATDRARTVRIEVRWPRGARSVIDTAGSGRLYEIMEPDGARPATAEPPPSTQPLFHDVSDRLGHRHHDAPYDDFRRQPLLPMSLSRQGPGVAWFDLDGDGDEDLIVGSAVFLNDGGDLRRVARALPTAAGDQGGVLGWVAAEREVLVARFDYRGDGVDLAVQAVTVDGRTRAIADPWTSAVGPMALADWDGDGDLDLFVGGRVVPGAYPAPASSRFYRNDGDRFTVDSANSALVEDIGLVSSAVFSDIDGDGDPDLVLAVEWGPITVLVNDGGRFRDATEEWGLAEHRGRWNGIATGDLTGNGRPDLVVTNWGRNTGYRASAQRPLLAYYGDLDRNGTMDVIEAQRDDARGAIVPLARGERLVSAIPMLQRRVESLSAYARATLEELLGDRIGGADRVHATTLDHMVMLNRGGRFEAYPLPVEAQFAPAFYAGVADADGDGHEDVFLSQNFFATFPAEAPYDAGRGLWLTGDGAGGLTPLPGGVSGVTVYGEQRAAGLADFDGDGRIDLVVSQHGNRTVLYRNVGAKPGLRVRLDGPTANPLGIGAVMRVRYADGVGPTREVQAGSGYWAQNGAIQVLGLSAKPQALWVRWPDGHEVEVPLAPGQRDVVVRR